MFYWTIALTAKQIALLKAFDEWGEGVLTRQPDEQWPGFNENTFLQTVGGLIRHRLVYHIDVPSTDPEDKRWNIKTRPKWGITDKGRLLIRVIAEDAARLKVDMSRIGARNTKAITSKSKNKEMA